MPFKPGRSGNPNGRPPGTANKVTTATKELLADFIEEVTPDIIEKFHTLEDHEQIRVFLKLLEYVVPKQKQVEQTIQSFPDKVEFIFERNTTKPITSETQMLKEHGEN
jgi:hypothetical protein